jgi:hypothetical protein
MQPKEGPAPTKLRRSASISASSVTASVVDSEDIHGEDESVSGNINPPAVIPVWGQLNTLGSVDARMNTLRVGSMDSEAEERKVCRHLLKRLLGHL